MGDGVRRAWGKNHRSKELEWQDVRNKRQRTQHNPAIITIFFENLPVSISRSWLMELFSKWDRVADVFILEKRKWIGKKLTFVRMLGEVGEEAASKAVQDSNGRWVGDRRIVTQKARYGREGSKQ